MLGAAAEFQAFLVVLKARLAHIEDKAHGARTAVNAVLKKFIVSAAVVMMLKIFVVSQAQKAAYVSEISNNITCLVFPEG